MVQTAEHEIALGEDSRRFVVDRSFLREQVGEAVLTFFAPLAGVAAAAGNKRMARIYGRKRKRTG